MINHCCALNYVKYLFELAVKVNEMKKQLISASVMLMGMFSVFAEEAKPLPPLDPLYDGSHNMVLVSKSSTIFASHLSKYSKPSNVQLLYKLDVKDVSLMQVVRDNSLVTVKLEKFNLQRLMRGEKVAIKADVYIGHFEQDGMLVYEGITLNFDEQLFLRELTELEESKRVQEYTAVSYNRKSSRIYVHHIQQAPSYDHLIHIELDASCPTKFATSSAVPTEEEIHRRLINCGTMKPMYYEKQSFANE